MNKKQFLEMASARPSLKSHEGEQADAWIEEHIMGNKVEWKLGVWAKHPKILDEGGEWVTVSRYMKDANAMMRIIDHMEDLGYAWVIDFDLVARNVYFIHADEPPGGKRHWGQWGNPLTVQVPLAAGRALGVIE